MIKTEKGGKMPTATEKALEQLKKMEEIKKAAIEEQLAIIAEANQTLALLGHTTATKVASKRGPKKCGKCGEVGHTKATCPKK